MTEFYYGYLIGGVSFAIINMIVSITLGAIWNE